MNPAAQTRYRKEEMNYRTELARHEELIQQQIKSIAGIVRSLREVKQAILEIDAAFRAAGLTTDGGVGSLPSPSEDLSPAAQSADPSATIRA